MKKIFLLIVTSFLIFSSVLTSLANDWLIEELLNLDKWTFSYELELKKLDTYTFKDKRLTKLYNNLKNYDKIIRKSLIKSYDEGRYDTYKMNWIIKNYTQFVSYANDFFYYISMWDNNKKLLDDIEMQEAILYTYKNTKEYYTKVKNLLKY